MTTDAFAAFALGAVLAAAAVAVVSVALSLRSPLRSRPLAWLCVAVALLLIPCGVGGYLLTMASVFQDVAGADASAKASLLAAGISEAMNCAALFAAALVAPMLAAVVLFVRAPKSSSVPAR